MTIVRPLEARPRGASLLIATLLVGLTVAFRLALLGQDPERPTFILFMLPVLASAHLGGWLGGASATALAAVAVDYLFVRPVGSFSFGSALDAAQWCAFLVVGLSVSALVAGLHDVRRRSEAHARDLAMFTAQKSVETSARESDARYRAILDQAAVGIALIETHSGKVREVNKGLCDMVGYSRDEMLAMRWQDFTHPDDVGADESSVRAITETREARHSEKRYVHKDGSEVWVSVAVSPLEAPDEEATLQVAVAVNISERKRADQAQRAQRVAEEQLARVVASVPGLLCSFEVRDDGTVSVSYASPGALDLLGCTAEEFSRDASAWHGRVNPDDLAALRAGLTACARDGSRWHGQCRYQHVTKGLRWIEASAVPRAEADGRTAWFAYLDDVTEHRVAQEGLRESDVRFRALIEKSSDMLVVFDEAMRVSLWSPSATERLGWTADEVMGRDGFALVHPEDRTRAREAFASIINAPGATVRVVYRQLHRDGSTRLVEVVARNLLREHAVRGVVANLHDITEQQRLTEQFQQAQKLESVGRLAGGVAHDFNNLLTVILGCSEAIRADLDQGAPVSLEDVEEIHAAGERARDLTRQLLAFARKQVIAPVTLDLNGVLRRSQKMLGRLLGEDVELRVKLQAGLWAILCDPGQIDQVIMNLAVNARDAMPRGGALTIETRNETISEDDARDRPEVQAGEWVQVVVSDNGTGMSPEVLTHIFEPFYTTKEHGKGTGLGLATVWGIVKQAGGHARVESEVGRGAAFTLCFPRTQRALASASQKAPPVARGGGETVLVAEDESGVRSVIAKTLRAGGYNVILASSGEEAVALFSSTPGPIDLLLTDVVMPGLDARTLVETLRRARPTLRVLYMSGYTDDMIGQHGVLVSGEALLPKPFTPKVLLDRIRRALDAG